MKKVLVVDDAVTVRMYHRSILESAGLTVEEAANGYEGLEKALSEQYALFLVDVNMPKMDGYRMVRRLREQQETRSTPVVMISTEAQQQDGEQAYQAGANLYLTKPVRPEDLSLIVGMLAGTQLR